MPKAKKRLTLWISLVVFLSLAAVAMVYLRQRSRPGDGGAVLPKMAAKAIMYLAGVRQTATKDGVVQWELKALSAELEAATGQMTLQEPSVEFFMENGDRAHLTARQGFLNTKTNNIEVQGDVRLKDSRYTLTTERLEYEHQRRMLHSPVPVRITGNTISVYAVTMWYNLETQQALFCGQVKGRLDEELPL